MLTDADSFDFPTTVTRGTDMSASAGESRTGHLVYEPVTSAQVARGRDVFAFEWSAALAGRPGTELEAMDLLRRPVARATCAAVLDLDDDARNVIADQVLAWIDALAPVISSRRAPRRWSRARRGERAARLELEGRLRAELDERPDHETPAVIANLLAAGVQVPIAAGAWLLVFLARTPHAVDPDHAVWESLRMAPPTWMTARVTTAPVTMGDQHLPAGAVVMVSPLQLGRLAELAPNDRARLEDFCPERWQRDDIRPGAWLPFGAGAHACPGRTLGLAMLRDLATWAMGQQLELLSPVNIDQSRGILPKPARIAVATPTQ